jgi:PAS domain S-box-containing protein
MPRIGTKLGVGMGTLVTLCLVIGIVSYTQTRDVASRIVQITEFKEPINSAVYGLENNMVETAFATLGYLTTGDPGMREVVSDKTWDFDSVQARYKEIADRSSDWEAWLHLRQRFERLQTVAAEQIDLRDLQAKNMAALLRDLDQLDALLTDKIVPSITPADPVAFRRLQAAMEMEVNVNAITKGLGDFMFTGESRFEDRIRHAEQEFRKYFKVYQVVVLSPEEAKWTSELRRLSDESVDLAKTIIDQQKKRTEKLQTMIDIYRDLGSTLNGQLKPKTEKGLAEAKEEVLRAGREADTRILFVLFLSVTFGLGAGIMTTRNITGPLRQLMIGMNAIARGDRAKKIKIRSHDELRSLGESFNFMSGELTRASDSLQESELLFRTMFMNAPVGIAFSDRDGRFTQTNPALEDMLGEPEEGLKGRALDEVVSPEDASGVALLSAEMAGGKRNRFQCEVGLRREDGRKAWISLNVSRLHHEGGHASSNIMMMEDITARRTTEQQMRMLAHTVTSMNESVVITDSKSNILSVNPAFCRIYGYAESEILGQSIGALSARTGIGGEAEDEALSILRSGSWAGELTHIRKNGDQFPALVSTSVVRDDYGAPVARVVIARDITEQKRLQEQLDAAGRRRSADLRWYAVSVQRYQEEERKRISRELHDDLCQRLTGMKFRAEALEDDIPAGSKRTVRELRDFGQELDKMIADVRRISSDLRPSVLDDFGLVTALRMLCKDFEKRHAVAMAFEIRGSEDVKMDQHIEIALYRIAQEALANIASHAHASTASLLLTQRDGAVQLVVEDDGTGFNLEEARRYSESGYRLGLIGMRERSELLGGCCSVESEIGKGTTVNVTIPSEGVIKDEENQDPDR